MIGCETASRACVRRSEATCPRNGKPANHAGPRLLEPPTFMDLGILNRVPHGPDRRVFSPKPPQNHRLVTIEFKSVDDSHHRTRH